MKENRKIDEQWREKTAKPPAAVATSPVYSNCTYLPGGIDTYFKREKVVGKGSYGEVYVAKATADGRRYIGRLVPDLPDRVAIKALTLKGAMDEMDVDTIKAEITSLKLLNIPSVVRYFGCYMGERNVWIVMEHIDGIDLIDMMEADVLSDFGRLSLVISLALAINAIHQQGIVHRDIKPENIMISGFADGTMELKLIDFGFACNEKNPASLTCSKRFLGTPNYVDPRFLINAGLAVNRENLINADWWSFARSVYFLYAEKHLFTGKACLDHMVDKRYHRIPDPGLMTTIGIPENLQRILVDIFSSIGDSRKQPSAEVILKALENDLRPLLEQMERGEDISYYRKDLKFPSRASK